MVAIPARTYPGVHERAVLIVEKEPAAAGGVQVEVVVAGLGGEQRAAPMDFILFRSDLSVHWTLRAEVEVDARIDLLDGRIVVDLVGLAVPRGIEGPQAARRDCPDFCTSKNGAVPFAAAGVAD